ncbi:neurogenic locus protein delta [Anthonomus grandis grandis]|uniref:neurogenic locus protein delta n=1 Tax=Anthonomus grandis grandis TaxID=2921223 RepID=UPI0021669AED|nr:neurogenic locus protein delta [Anthonomus grandis grandis]XP_050314805.1 neurogenic locus protein delta [Anthonomus grandis grandis]
MFYWIFFSLIGFSLVLQTPASGVFELRLLSFDNQAGKDDQGRCCSGRPLGLECEGECRPRFRICLKEYQVKIDATSTCTFGDVSTSELGPGPADDPQSGFANAIAVKIPFTWPGSFSLIVEAWHGSSNSTVHSPVLVSRLMRHCWLDVGEQWTEETHSSKYSTLRFKYRVTCEPNYYGKGCENVCRPRDDNFGHYSCSSTGKRVCLAGWTGDYCTTPLCLPGCDEQHGHCVHPNECICQSGWEGPLCDKCQRYPGCNHGTCVKPWECLCNEGWGGLFCNQDLNFCTNHLPCKNGGTCYNTGQGSYTCSCPPGFNGTDCEIPTDDCTKTPCLNGGSCKRPDNGDAAICQCPSGYHGSRCQTAIPPPPSQSCSTNPCANGGSCQEIKGGFRCTCRPGYTGPTCERRLGPCEDNPCEHGGVCSETSSTQYGYRCACPAGFAGDRCQIDVDECASGNPCFNGGTCIDKVNEFRCQCVPGFVGRLCQERVDYCIAKPCANGGTCHQLLNDYQCRCPPGFGGKDCSKEVDKCRANPCKNGGTCRNRIRDYECDCPMGFIGRDCSESSVGAASSARISTESTLTAEHVVVIATISTFVPLLALVAVGVIACLKQRRKREKARADEEARLQNEQNTANSSFAKRGAAMAADARMIKNSWNKCTNNVLEESAGAAAVCDMEPFPKQQQQVIDGRPVYGLQRSRSQKQLNTESSCTAANSAAVAAARASALLVAKLHEPEYEPIKRLSVMSQGDPPTKDTPVFVVEEHFRVPVPGGLFATEV